jgi:tyrosyl-tRNA synthetase
MTVRRLLLTGDCFRVYSPRVPHLLDILSERGLVHDATPGLAKRLAQGPITGYVGFDPTADSLHVGNLVPVMALAWLQRQGGRPIALVGGGTGMVGDPSGKRSERPVLTVEQIDANAAAVEVQLRRYLDFTGPQAARLVNNAAWLRPLRLLDFLRDIGKHFTVNYMLQKESVKSRMDSGISFTEFAYMLVMAYDYLHLHQSDRCELQLGGSDQWGNITAGIELIARREQAEVHGLVCPLLTTAAGDKFGKSEGENVWLDPARTSPYRFHQFWLNSDDQDVERLLQMFTFLPLERIRDVMAGHAADPGRRAAQRLLAEEMTTRVHGEEVARRALAAGGILFGGAELASADAETLALLAGEVPVHRVAAADLERGLPVVDALVGTGLASSKADARRGLLAGGFSVNGTRQSAERTLTPNDLLARRYVVLQKGKKNYALLEVR